jgi:hypothetical protein
METILFMHDFSLPQNENIESIRRKQIIVFEVENILDCFKFLEIIVPSLIIIVIDSALNKTSAHTIYCEFRKSHLTKKIPLLFYDSINHECLLYWKRPETKAKDSYLLKNCKFEQILETVQKIISIQHKKIQMLESQFTKSFESRV